MIKFTAIAIVSALTLTACANSPYDDGGIHKREIGTGIGALGGAVIGSSFGKGNGRVVGGVAGALLGAGLGSSIGASLDRADLTYQNQAAQQAFEYAPAGKTVAWNNPDNGHTGQFKVTNTYQQPNTGRYCREYSEKVNVGGTPRNAYGTACRQPDGNWQIVSEQ